MEARAAGHSGRLCGADPADGMLERARQSADIEWVATDLSEPLWDGEFELVVMTGHAFQALVTDEEIGAALASVRQALRPRGLFAFETRNPAVRAWEAWRPENARTIRGPGGEPVRITTEVVAPFDGRTVTFTHTFTGDHASLPQVSRSTLRFLEAGDLARRLTAAGLRIEAQFGDFDCSPLGPASPEIVTFARREA